MSRCESPTCGVRAKARYFPDPGEGGSVVHFGAAALPPALPGARGQPGRPLPLAARPAPRRVVCVGRERHAGAGRGRGPGGGAFRTSVTASAARWEQ